MAPSPPARDRADVVVVGAGVAGLGVAAALARAGGPSVLVVEMEPSYAFGATGRAAGSVRRQLHTPLLTRIAIEGTRDLLALAGGTGDGIECEAPGYVNLASSAAWEERLLAEDRMHRACGLDTLVLGPEEAGRRWRFLRADDLRVATCSPGDLNVDPYAVAAALFRAARGGGARFLFGTRVTGIERGAGGAVSGVATDAGRIEAPAVVNAAGAWAGPLCAAAGAAAAPPLRPVRRQVWRLAGMEGLGPVPFIVDNDAPFYVRSLRGSLLLSLMEEDEVPLLDNEPPFEWSWMFRIEERAGRRIPAIAGAAVAKGWAGWRTVTPDDTPLVGPVEGVPGLYLCGGFGGHGIALAPRCGLMLASLLRGEARFGEELAGLAPGRVNS